MMINEKFIKKKLKNVLINNLKITTIFYYILQ